MQVHLTLKSSNKKVGPIPVSTTERSSCGDCAFKKNGCYADYGPLSMHWDKVSSHERGTDWQTFCNAIDNLPDGTLWRHNQAGDLPHINGTIDFADVAKLVRANIGKRGFTYTHHKPTAQNMYAIRHALYFGFVVNLSGDTLSDADRIADTGLPTVTVLPADQLTNTVTPKGRLVVVCPAVTRDNVSCSTCQLCAIANRKVIVGFPAHGTGKKRVIQIFNA
jgi:hypothetical protein